MREIEAKTLLSAKNTMNIYRGCTHGCIYCDSRSECYGMTYTFEDVQVKVNAETLLQKELGKRREKCMVFTGSMSDPYLPIERELQYTRRCLELIEKQEFGVSILTKSDLILRDLDVLKRIHQKTKCVVQMSLTCHDEALSKVVEPHVCTTKRRIEVLKQLHEEGLPTIAWLTPILPFINDTEENVSALLEACREAEVHGILTFGIGMTLRYGNREYYYQKLDEHFPTLKRQYMKTFGSSYGVKSPKKTKLSKMIRDFCAKENILYGEKEVFAYLTQFPQNTEQLSFFE